MNRADVVETSVVVLGQAVDQIEHRHINRVICIISGEDHRLDVGTHRRVFGRVDLDDLAVELLFDALVAVVDRVVDRFAVDFVGLNNADHVPEIFFDVIDSKFLAAEGFVAIIFVFIFLRCLGCGVARGRGFAGIVGCRVTAGNRADQHRGQQKRGNGAF